MPNLERISPLVSREAKNIYDSLRPHKKGDWVSQAIVEKRDKENGTGIDEEVQQLKARVKALETVVEQYGGGVK